MLRTLTVSVALTLAGGATLYAATAGFEAFTTEAARRIAVRQQPVQVPAVVLQTQSGTQIDFARLRGKWLVVNFIYTRCPTYCRVLGSEFARIQRLLADAIAQGRLRLLSISFDPEHDTTTTLRSYLQRMGSHGTGWLATRPVTPQGLAQLKRVFGVTVIPNEFGGYTHNVAVYIVDPQGRVVDILDAGNPEVVVQAMSERFPP